MSIKEKKVYHATAKNFKKFGFVSKDEAADIGFHVGTPVQAERRTTKKDRGKNITSTIKDYT